MNCKLLVLLFFGMLLNGCSPEPFTMEFESANKAPDIVVESPCKYLDTAIVDGFSGCKGNVQVEMREHFDYEEARLSWYSSSSVLTFEYYSRYGFAAVNKSMEFDLSKNGGYPLKVSYISYGSFGFTYTGVSGKVYITKLPNGKLRADFCNVLLKDSYNNRTTYARGGFLMP